MLRMFDKDRINLGVHSTFWAASEQGQGGPEYERRIQWRSEGENISQIKGICRKEISCLEAISWRLDRALGRDLSV